MKRGPYLTFLALFLLLKGTSEGKELHRGFRTVDSGKCLIADSKIMSSLPANWQKYNGFVKKCALAKNGQAAVSIISIWIEEFFEKKYPPPAIPHWEAFPLPVITDTGMRTIGSLPEIFPVGDGTFLTIKYGRWKGYIPTEIRIDVENPAEGGDYYYKPLLYNSLTGRYELKDKEITHGTR